MQVNSVGIVIFGLKEGKTNLIYVFHSVGVICCFIFFLGGGGGGGGGRMRGEEGRVAGTRGSNNQLIFNKIFAVCL